MDSYRPSGNLVLLCAASSQQENVQKDRESQHDRLAQAQPHTLTKADLSVDAYA
jgi:hypothetical protein